MNETVKAVIVDDHPLIAHATRELLEQMEEIEVVGVAHDGHSGMELVDRVKPGMLFLDYQLPDVVGTDIAAQMKEKYPQMHVVIFTGVDVSAMINTLLRLQVSGVITKGTKHAAIKHMIASILENHIVLPRSLITKINLMDVSHEFELSEDEIMIMNMIVKGATLEQIAAQIHVSKRSVDNYQRKIYDKLAVKTRAQAIEKFIHSSYYTETGRGE